MRYKLRHTHLNTHTRTHAHTRTHTHARTHALTHRHTHGHESSPPRPPRAGAAGAAPHHPARPGGRTRDAAVHQHHGDAQGGQARVGAVGWALGGCSPACRRSALARPHEHRHWHWLACTPLLPSAHCPPHSACCRQSRSCRAWLSWTALLPLYQALVPSAPAAGASGHRAAARTCESWPTLSHLQASPRTICAHCRCSRQSRSCRALLSWTALLLLYQALVLCAPAAGASGHRAAAATCRAGLLSRIYKQAPEPYAPAAGVPGHRAAAAPG